MYICNKHNLVFIAGIEIIIIVDLFIFHNIVHFYYNYYNTFIIMPMMKYNEIIVDQHFQFHDIYKYSEATSFLICITV